MKRDARIYCRTNEQLRDHLESYAAAEKRSVSSVIEFALAEFLRNRSEMKGEAGEKRRYRRKNVTIPALVKATTTEESGLESGLVMDLSLGGLCMALTKESATDLGDGAKNKRFEAAFVLPGVQKPVRILCRRERTVPLGDGCCVGASFVGADFDYYHHLQEYLLG
jgi:hypothetical protein